MSARPRFIVLPILPGTLETAGSAGLSLHFLLGNVMVLHTGLREFWFGWRVKRIFPEPNAYADYRQGAAPKLDLASLGKAEEIRYWLSGRFASPETVDLALFDAEARSADATIALHLDLDGGLVNFRKSYMAWLAEIGLPMPDGQRAKALWIESISPEGLDLTGRALDRFYTFSAYGDAESLDMAPFEHAAAASPASFLTQDLLGWAHYRNQRYDDARGAFLKALDANPHSNGVMAGLMWCGVQTGDREDACRWAARKAETRLEDTAAAREKAVRLMEKHGTA